MRTYIIAIRDVIANVYTQPVTTPSLGAAIREFGDRCKDKTAGNIVGQHPKDFELWVIGEFDDSDGKIEEYKAGKQIAVGANYAEINAALANHGG